MLTTPFSFTVESVNSLLILDSTMTTNRILTENYAKHTFQVPCSCFKSGLTKASLLFKTIIKYLICFGRKINIFTALCAVKFVFFYNWIIPRIMHYISFALHLKNLPHQHEMHAMSRFKCHALHLHFMK